MTGPVGTPRPPAAGAASAAAVDPVGADSGLRPLADLVEVTIVVDPVFDQNCYVLRRRDTDRALVVDPGLQGERVARLLDDRRWGCDGILATHGHPDHVLGVPHVRRVAPAAPLRLHRADWALLDPSAWRDQGLPVGDGGAIVPDEDLPGGAAVRWLGLTLAVRHTPGHTPGSVCLLVGGDCFSGDTLFADSVGRTDLPGGSWPQLVFSIRSQLFTLPGPTAVHPGHGRPTTIGAERLGNPFVGQSAAP